MIAPRGSGGKGLHLLRFGWKTREKTG